MSGARGVGNTAARYHSFASGGVAAAAVVAPSIAVLVVARVMRGLGSAGVVVVTRAMVADRASGREAARASSILTGITAAGPFAAPLIGADALIGAGRASFLVLPAPGPPPHPVGCMLCVLASVVCAVVGRGGFRLPPDARSDEAPIPRPARAPQGKHPRNTP